MNDEEIKKNITSDIERHKKSIAVSICLMDVSKKRLITLCRRHLLIIALKYDIKSNKFIYNKFGRGYDSFGAIAKSVLSDKSIIRKAGMNVVGYEPQAIREVLHTILSSLWENDKEFRNKVIKNRMAMKQRYMNIVKAHV